MDLDDEELEATRRIYNNKEKEYVSKKKIREKIIELEKLYNVTLEEPMTSYEMFCFVRSYIVKVKNILEELLEE